MTGITKVWLEERSVGERIGMGDRAPRISWLRSDDQKQRAYEIAVRLHGGSELTTGRVASESSRLVDWPITELTSRQGGELRVRVWGTGEAPGEWSAPLRFEAGLLERSDWSVDFASPSTSAPQDGPRPAYLMRSTFTVDGEIARARLYSTAHGAYEVSINGTAPSNDLLAPGWSSFGHRIRYQTHDLTELIRQGENTIGAWLGDGWYRGRLGFNGGLWDNYGEDVALLAQLELTAVDGTIAIVDLDQWLWQASPITSAGLYEGETFDGRRALELEGWSSPGFDASDWKVATRLPLADFPAELEAPTGPPVRVVETLPVAAFEVRDDGRIRLDFGQNIAGKLEITVSGELGEQITLHHAEELEDDELAIRPLRAAPSVDTFVCSGRTEETWSPRFTLHGFRYAEIEGWPGEFDASKVSALVVHSDMERTGWFDSSDPLLNRLHENVVWSMRDNFVDLPTDCPQRDERLGWTGDIQVFAPTASFLYSVHGVLEGWLRDVAAEQRQFGSVPNFVPWIECGFPPNPAAAWGDAAVIVPWVLYERYGDDAILNEQYDSMRAWVDQVAALSRADGLWSDGFQLGDWLDPAAPPDNPAASRTDKYLVSSAYRARSTRLFARAAEVLGRTDDARRYSDMADGVDAAFRREFVTPNGRLASDTPTAYSLAILFDLLQDHQRAVAGTRLAELVAEGDYRISTGFVGTPIICDALVATGSSDVAYHLLFQKECPSWLYPVTMGATTIWERWDSKLPDGTINPGEMTSFNHYALGAVADFLHRTVAGLAPSSPGYATIDFSPKPGGGLRAASARHVTPYGEASSSWTRAGETFTLTVTVPPGCSATVRLPGSDEEPIAVEAGAHSFTSVFRAAEDDPAMPEQFNIHNPEHRALLEESTAA